MNPKRKIIALAGLSGSGKTTLIARARGTLDFEHFSASSLIKSRTGRPDVHADSDALRLGDIDANQMALIQAFAEQSSSIQGNIVFDCHTVIDTPTELRLIPIKIFETIGITDFAFLSVDPEIILARRQKDNSRIRPSRSLEELEDHQNKAEARGREIARTLSIPFTDIGENPDQGLMDILTRPTYRVDASSR